MLLNLQKRRTYFYFLVVEDKETKVTVQVHYSRYRLYYRYVVVHYNECMVRTSTEMPPSKSWLLLSILWSTVAPHSYLLVAYSNLR